MDIGFALRNRRPDDGELDRSRMPDYGLPVTYEGSTFRAKSTEVQALCRLRSTTDPLHLFRIRKEYEAHRSPSKSTAPFRLGHFSGLSRRSSYW